jgi:hypothetical protein
MNRDHMTSLLVAGATGDPRRSPDCPNEHEIAGYVDGGLDETARERVELHLAGCGRCLDLVGLLCRERDDDVTEPVPDDVLAQARALVTKGPQRRWRLAPWWAAAATVVLAVPLLLQIGRNLDRGVEGQGRPEPPATRTFASPPAGMRLLAPGAGAVMDARRLAFHWTEVPGTPFYDVRILTDAGDVVIRQRVIGTSWTPPGQLKLQPGAEYFVHVDAYPSGDKAVSTDHVPFRISD